MKSALFVDFDNVYSGLRKLDQASADRFASRPTEWMNWMVSSLGLPEHAAPGSRRRVLVRRCYLNPQAYQRFRPAFNLAGFEIIDCPALTSEGKTSTDIHMVLDIIDLLQHEAHYDEFIVFSADADFTPVLRKLRRWDRRTTVLAIGFPSAAYRSSADLLIDQDDFVRNALGFRSESESLAVSLPVSLAPAVSPPPDALQAAAALIRQKVAESSVAVPLPRLASLMLADLTGIDAATWAGFGNFRSLIEALSLAPLAVNWIAGGYVYDPTRHAPPVAAAPLPAGRFDGELGGVAALIRNELANSRVPVPCARLAAMIMSQNNALGADWNGKATFRKFVEGIDLSPIRFDWSSAGGYAWDPELHGAPLDPDTELASADWGPDGRLLAVARQVHEVTDAPLLSPDSYRALFEALAADLQEQAFHLVETCKTVRDRCRKQGMAISRADVNFVLRGLLLRGHVFGGGRDDAATLSRKLADNIRSLCLREQMVLDQTTDAAILKWIAGVA